MNKPLFIKPISTLGTYIISFEEINKKWKCDKRYPESAIQRFIQLNSKSLSFLGIKAESIFHEGKYALQFITSNYVGCIPIYSPANGKICGDLVVTGRFNEDISELLSVIGGTILPEFNSTLQLSSSEIVKPPLYFECANFIDKYIEAQKKNWKKFTNSIKTQNFPTSSTLWNNYAFSSINPFKALKYQNKCNTLSNNHIEWNALNYVLHIAINELKSIQTPLRSRMAYAEKINKLENHYSKEAIQITSNIPIHMADPRVIKELKAIANIILKDSSNKNFSWRLDFSLFFERYVQFLFHSIALIKGAKNIKNPHYQVYGIRKPEWCLSYLEPDAVIQKGNEQYIIDAKYKSHMYNTRSNTENLKDAFRSDLHQILAYCSFNCMSEKKALLVYPAAQITSNPVSIKSSLNGLSCQITMLGIPLLKSEIENIKKELIRIIQFTTVI